MELWTFSDFPKFINFLVKNLHFLLFWIIMLNYYFHPNPPLPSKKKEKTKQMNTDFKAVLTDPS